MELSGGNSLGEFMENKKILLDDHLEEASGGKIKLSGYGLLTAFVLQMKELGKDRDYCIQALKESWEENNKFKMLFTDQEDSDLRQAIDYIKGIW